MGDVRAGNAVICPLLNAPAQKPYRVCGLFKLRVKLRPLHGDEGSAALYVRQAQLAQQVQPCDRAGHSKVEALAVSIRHLLRPCVDALHIVKAELCAGIAQKADALIETVEQRELHFRTGDLQRKAGEARTGADVYHARARKVLHTEQRRAVKKVQARHIRFTGDGGEVHDLVCLFKVFVVYAVALRGSAVKLKAELGKAAAQNFFKHSLSHL